MKIEKVHMTVLEMTERVKINVSVVDNPETLIKKLKREKYLDQLDHKISSCDMLNNRSISVLTKISQDLNTKEYFVILDSNKEIDENIHILFGIAFQLHFNYHRNLDTNILFAKLVLAAFGKYDYI